MNHLAIYNKKAFGDDYIRLMLQGKKTLDSKFTDRKTAPYQRLSPGDVVYLKESSGPIRGRLTVGKVVNKILEGPDDVMNFLAPKYKSLGIKDEDHLLEVWKHHAGKKYVCQWEIVASEPIAYPVSIYKRDMRIWVPDYEVPEEVSVAFAQ
jgi:hypothetical protein